jgi:hypothetical protein
VPLSRVIKWISKVDIRKKDEVPHRIGSTGPAQDVLESKNDSVGFLRYHRVPKGANYPTFSRFSLSYVLFPSLSLSCRISAGINCRLIECSHADLSPLKRRGLKGLAGLHVYSPYNFSRHSLSETFNVK